MFNVTVEHAILLYPSEAQPSQLQNRVTNPSTFCVVLGAGCNQSITNYNNSSYERL